MREIFKRCSCVDLLQLCLADGQLRSAVLEYGIPGKLIDFSEFGDFPIEEVFKIFGAKMTKMEISERDVETDQEGVSEFDEILRLISAHCAMDTLKYLNLQYDRGTSVRKRFVCPVLPFLRSLESFVITESVGAVRNPRMVLSDQKFCPTVNDFIDSIVANGVQLKSIELQNVQIAGNLFYVQHVRNLESLVLDACHILESKGFVTFMESKPKLKSFSWIHSYAPGLMLMSSGTTNAVCALTENNIPDLEQFHYHPIYVDSSMAYAINYDSLLTKLQNLKVMSIHELGDTELDVLVQKNSVQELRVFACRRDVEYVEGSKTLNISNYSKLKCISVLVNDDVDMGCYMLWLQEMPNITKLYVQFAVDFDFLFSVELYVKLMAKFTAHPDSLREPLRMFIEKDSVARLIFLLGQNYKKDLFPICACNFN